MANKSPQNKRRISIPIVVASIGLIGVCITTIGAIIVGVFPEVLSVFNFNKEKSISFRVTEISGASVPQAKIILLSGNNVYNDYTDSNGVVIFTAKATKDLRVFVETSQYEVYDQIISDVTSSPIEVRLNPKDVSRKSVIIRTLDSKDSSPINGAEVVLIVNNNVYSQITDSNGITKFTTGFPSDEIDGDISVSFNGFSIERQRVTLQADRVQDISLDKATGTVNVSFTGGQSTNETTSNPTSSVLPDVIANDIPGTPISIGTTITSTLDQDSKPRDVFAIDIKAGQTLSINISSTKNISVYLHKVGAISMDNSYYITMCDYTSACTNTYLVPVSGTYYINVRARDDGLQYTLKADTETTLQPPQIANNVPGTPLQIGSSVTSVLDDEIHQRDVFAIDLVAGQTLRITTSSSKNITVYLHKVGTISIDNSQYITMCDYTSACTNTYLVPVSGTYYINVRARDDGLQYTLKADAETTLQPPQIANNVPGTPLQIGSSVTSVLDDEIHQRDVFAIDLVAGQTLRINVSSSKNITVFIHKVGTTTVENSDYEILCDYTMGCTNTFLIPVTGIYFIQVRARDDGLQYTLSIAVE